MEQNFNVPSEEQEPKKIEIASTTYFNNAGLSGIQNEQVGGDKVVAGGSLITKKFSPRKQTLGRVHSLSSLLKP